MPLRRRCLGNKSQYRDFFVVIEQKIEDLGACNVFNCDETGFCHKNTRARITVLSNDK